VTTLAGLAGQTCVNVDGTGAAARFCDPEGVAVDVANRIYVADAGNCTIRKITAAGVVNTVAGMPGSCGSGDGAGSAARFNHPFGLTVDEAGNIYVADTVNHTIRRVTPTELVTTVAGAAGIVGSTDGTAGAARFYGPSGIAVGSDGKLYVADSGNFTIREGVPSSLGESVLPAPASLSATGPGSLTWSGVAGATSYNVKRGFTSGGETLLAVGVTTTSFTDTAPTGGQSCFYAVSAANMLGESANSNEVVSTVTLTFSDDPLTTSSMIRAVHITEMRARIDALRMRYGLSRFGWTDNSLFAGMTISAVHLTELRTALQQAYAAAGASAPSLPPFTDPTIVPGSTFIRVVQIKELRDAVIALEAS
jgi:hypothetical protein